MGQAKNRGTYEERKAEAIQDNAVTVQLLKEQRSKWWNSLSEEEKEFAAINHIEKITKKVC